MVSVLGYFKNFFKHDFRWDSFITILVLNAILIYLNWGLGMFNWIRNVHGLESYVVLIYWLLFFLVFILPVIIQSFFSENYIHFKKPFFYVFILFTTLIFACRFSYYHFNDWLKIFYEHSAHEIFWNRITNSVFRFCIVLIPILIFWFLFERKRQSFYGCTGYNFNLRPYFMMLLLMVPLITLASTQSDFLGAYPRAKFLHSYSIQNMQHWKYFLIYELFYGMDFFSIELFFRGFLILGAIRVLGSQAILAASTFYVVIHFGKPMGEAISSFFGGTILGVITFYGRSIWGGLIVHVGIAWMMELGAMIGTWMQR